MKYLAAYTLLVLGGKASPTAEEVTALLKEVAIDVDAAAVKKVVDALKGKKLEEVIAEGSKKTANMSFGGGSQAPAEAPVAKAAVVAPKKVEEKVEVVEDDMDMGGMFD